MKNVLLALCLVGCPEGEATKRPVDERQIHACGLVCGEARVASVTDLECRCQDPRKPTVVEVLK